MDLDEYKKLKKKVMEKLKIDEQTLDKMIDEKYNEYGGILLKTGILYLIAKEHGIDLKEEEFLIKDIKEGMIVDIIGVVRKVYDVKEYDGKKVRKIIIADKSGSITVSLWNELADIEIKEGDVIRLKRVKARKWNKRLELTSLPETEIEILEDYKIELPEYKISDLIPGMVVELEGEVVLAFPVKEFEKDNKKLKLKSFNLRDETGVIRVVLWNELTEIDVRRGDFVKVKGVVKEGYYGGLEIVADEVEIIERGEKIESEVVNIKDLHNYENEIVSVRGKVLALGNKKIVNIDGKRNKVQEILLDDGSGKVKITFWKGLINLLENIKEGDIIKVTNCKVKSYIDREGNIRYDLIATIDSEVIKEGESEYKIKFVKIKDIVNKEVDWEDINLIAIVVDITEHEFDGRKVKNILLEDDTGRIRLSIWEDLDIDIEEGDFIKVYHAYAKERDDYIDLYLGRFGRIEKSDERVIKRKFIADLLPGDKVEIRGTIVEVLNEEPFIYMCPNCRKIITEEVCEDCKVEAEKVLRLNVILDDGTGVITCRLYNKKVERLLKIFNVLIENFKEKLLGEEIIFYGNVKDQFIVRALKPVNVDEEIKILSGIKDES
ncbi:replication factor A [Methanocaldococcus villosus KIN24-T80]|uniref:Replication factor A n=1 Tax=Methanocaldococcus villosus KIN24-T80 TaxID=1069083 RepID=N6V2X8_9EURY|nr:OB-fold nucleic acid binding domain-containing protein [Methanocaldococcus villosus]ENN96583.1 replication factor A [Methanocaldococcus villosus KIN24-T80]